jgi:sortase A
MKSLSNILAILGVVALGYWGAITLKARLYQMREQKHFSAPPSRPNPQRTPPPAPKPAPKYGTVFAMLVIPRIGLSAVVVEGTGEQELQLGPGHIPATPLPGEGGNVGVAGHRDTFFRPLRHIRTDDIIRLVSREQEFRYKVVSTQVVDPTNVGVLSPTGRETLTLVTCYPFQYVGSAPKRFIVRADCTDCLAAASEPAAASQTARRTMMPAGFAHR